MQAYEVGKHGVMVLKDAKTLSQSDKVQAFIERARQEQVKFEVVEIKDERGYEFKQIS